MTWERTAERYLDVLESARRDHQSQVATAPEQIAPAWDKQTLPDMRIGHLLSMCDDTGLFQHAVHSVPDRHHGYCVDDNARALLLACALNDHGERRLPEIIDRPSRRIRAACVESRRPGRFRNFMSFDRRWLEDKRLRGQPRANTLGVGRMCAQRRQPVTATVGLRLVRRGLAGGRGALPPREPGRSRCSGWMPTTPRCRRTFAPPRCGNSSRTG